jgi:indolepyruvate ferredoxin oxidoreductase
MAYKDEYEVARLHTEHHFVAKISEQFEPGYKITHYLAPPLLSAHNAQGEAIKQRFGSWIRPVMTGLRHLKILRGTPLDPFEYQNCIEALLPELTPDNIDLAVQIASVPEHIRGYGHVKAKHLEESKNKTQKLLEQWHKQI